MGTDGNSHFLMAIGRHDGGSLIETLDGDLAEVVSAVRRTGKKGTLTIVMEVIPNGENAIKVAFKNKSVTPRLATGEAFYFATPDNELSREAPKAELTNLFEQNRRA